MGRALFCPSKWFIALLSVLLFGAAFPCPFISVFASGFNLTAYRSLTNAILFAVNPYVWSVVAHFLLAQRPDGENEVDFSLIPGKG